MMALGGSLQTITSICFDSTDELVLGSSTDNSTRIWHLGTQRLRVRNAFSYYYPVVYSIFFLFQLIQSSFCISLSSIQ